VDTYGEMLFRTDMGVERGGLGSLLLHSGPIGQSEVYAARDQDLDEQHLLKALETAAVRAQAERKLLATMWDAFRFAFFGFLVGLLRSHGRFSTFILPTVWVALEWLWPHLFPWRIGQSQLGWLPLCQIAEVTGTYGVSFLLRFVRVGAGSDA